MRSKVAMAFGSFDVLHPGHLHYLRSASRYGKLVVVVGRDSSIAKLKGKRPLMDERSRLRMVSALKYVDRAVLGARVKGWNDTYKILPRFKPDFIVLGYDQHVDMKYLKRFLEDNDLDSKIVRVGPHNSRRFKSSKLKKAAATH